jgi:hypothetical protein
VFFDPTRGLAIITLDVAEGTDLERIKTPCGVVVSPAAPAEVILRDESCRDLVYDASYGQLPDGTIVVAVHDDSGTFPLDQDQVRVRVVLDAYQDADEPWVLDAQPVAWGGGCPICGELDEIDLAGSGGDDAGESDEDEDDDDQFWRGGDVDDDVDDDGDDEGPWTHRGGGLPRAGEEETPPDVVPMPRRFAYEDLIPPSPN